MRSRSRAIALRACLRGVCPRRARPRVGLTPLGWAAGCRVDAATLALLGAGQGRARRADGPHPADQVTLVRATLVGGVAALVAGSFSGPVNVTVLVGMATLVLVLDAVDGQLARRTHTQSALGARFDMEVDAFLILVLSVYVARSLGAWVLLIGLARYFLLAAGYRGRGLRSPTPPRYWAKVVAATQAHRAHGSWPPTCFARSVEIVVTGVGAGPAGRVVRAPGGVARPRGPSGVVRSGPIPRSCHDAGPSGGSAFGPRSRAD